MEISGGNEFDYSSFVMPPQLNSKRALKFITQAALGCQG